MTTTTHTTALEDIERQLRTEAEVLHEADLWSLAYLYQQLAHVVDFTRRCTLESASSHYRADKAGQLARAAISVSAAALGNYAEATGEADPDDAVGSIDELHELAGDVVALLRNQSWRVAKAHPVYRSDVDEFRKVLARLAGLHAELDLIALADPVE